MDLPQHWLAEDSCRRPHSGLLPKLELTALENTLHPCMDCGNFTDCHPAGLATDMRFTLAVTLLDHPRIHLRGTHPQIFCQDPCLEDLRFTAI